MYDMSKVNYLAEANVKREARVAKKRRRIQLIFGVVLVTVSIFLLVYAFGNF